MVPKLFVVVAAVLGIVAPGAAAVADTGSVPTKVAAYVAEDMTSRLAELYGPGPDGAGIDFDDTTTPGTVTRVWAWSEALLAGRRTDAPVVLRNEWVVPISVDSAVVGVATVWINPANDSAELAEFSADPALATALAAAPSGSALVHDEVTRAWFAVAGTTATPLVIGRSGVTTPTPLAKLHLTAPPSDTTTNEEPAPIISAAIIVVAVVGLLTVSALVLVGMRRGARRREAS